MKFFWKIFFTTMFVSVICFAAGGYYLTNFNFRTLLDAEIQSSYELGDIVFQSLSSEFSTLALNYYGKDNVSDKDILEQVAETINIKNANQKISFCIMDSEGKVIFSSLAPNFEKGDMSELSQNDKTWTLRTFQGNTYVQTIRPAFFGNTLYRIETMQNVQYIFNNQRSQYITLLNTIVLMLIIAGVITFIISKLLMRQVDSLIKVTKNISAGNLSERVIVKGDDEFALLSEDFNSMADDLEDKIKQMEDEAERKELFVGDFSHELKTPLTSIIGYADMLRQKELSTEKVRFCAEYIFTEGKRLENLSMRLLDLIVLKNQDVVLNPISINELFKQVLSVVIHQLNEQDIQTVVELEETDVYVEHELMKTVFINLIDNSRKAIDGVGKITVRGRVHGDTYTVKVEDTGKGMEEEELSKINEAFYMVDKSRSRKQGGAGLGLSICEEILNLHGFSIGFESTVNVGTVVSVTMKGAVHEQI